MVFIKYAYLTIDNEVNYKTENKIHFLITGSKQLCACIFYLSYTNYFTKTMYMSDTKRNFEVSSCRFNGPLVA